MVGRFTSSFLLHRLALSVFSAVYAFGRKVGDRPARVWPSVLRELRLALAVLPLVQSDLSRPVAECLVQTDASDTGGAAVYTTAVPHDALRRECLRPRHEPKPADAAADPWCVERALAASFVAPTDPAAWRVAFRQTFAPGTAARTAHINAKELSTAVDAVRWACRSARTRRCRLVLELDSAVAVSVLRKGRSSRPGLRRLCRRLAAVSLAEQVAVEARWIPTTRNMADQPSRGGRTPGPCLSVPAVRPRGRGQGGYTAERVGESDKPGPLDRPSVPQPRPLPPSLRSAFWSPLALPAHVSDLARRVECLGLVGLLAPDLRAHLRR